MAGWCGLPLAAQRFKPFDFIARFVLAGFVLTDGHTDLHFNAMQLGRVLHTSQATGAGQLGQLFAADLHGGFVLVLQGHVLKQGAAALVTIGDLELQAQAAAKAILVHLDFRLDDLGDVVASGEQLKAVFASGFEFFGAEFDVEKGHVRLLRCVCVGAHDFLGDVGQVRILAGIQGA